ncbi:MAG: pilus (MSHA type) biogenesis protein MshL [Magnetococcales bacterium]|nr:pilus (MSHA type) biogenesis protein MshL [Magnetococcales bacterium]
MGRFCRSNNASNRMAGCRLAVGSLLLLSSCATPEPKPGGEFAMAQKALLEDIKDSSRKTPAAPGADGRPVQPRGAVPPEVSQALMPGLDMHLQKKATDVPILETRFDVMVDNAPAREFFMGLVAETPINMVVHPDVNGSISLTLKDVTVDRVVETACKMYQFDCQKGVNGFEIYPRRLTTRTFKLDFLPMTRSGRSQTRVSSGNTQQTQSTSGTGTSAATSTTTNTSGSDVTTSNDADFWKELEDTLRVFLGLAPKVTTTTGQSGGTAQVQQAAQTPAPATPHLAADGTPIKDPEYQKGVIVNRQAGLVVVRAHPEDLREIDNYLTQLAQGAKRQVILEAKILEVELSDGFQYGINWLAVSRGLGKQQPLASEPRKGTTMTDGSASSMWEANRPVSVPVITDTASTALTYQDTIPYWKNTAAILSQAQAGDPFALAMKAGDFVGFLDLLRQQGKVQVLSSPRVATTNNQKAVIKVGEDEIFVTDVNISTTEFGTNLDPTFTPFFSGVALDVTPQIGDDGAVTLHIHPMVTEVTDKVKTFAFGTTTQVYPLALARSREVDSIVRVKDGEVVVIGGLMKREMKDSDDKVPILGDLPLIGRMFGRTSRSWVKNELVILLRPRLVVNSESWHGVVEETADRVKSMTPEPMIW